MAKLLKLRRGTTTQHASFTGAEGEVTVDTSKDTAVIHDGSQAGGRPLAREDMNNVSSASIAGRLATDSIAPSKIGAGGLPSDVTIGSANIVDGTIVNADIAANAAIAGTKLENSGVTAGTYGSSSAIPIVVVDAQGLVTGASTTAIDSTKIQNGTSEVSVASSGNITMKEGGTERLVVNTNGIYVPGTAIVTGNTDFGAGIDVTGNITVTGTVDGRDVAADGTKLDGIESGATADQTAAEIRTLVESAGNSNVFTDADHTKLNGIETSATADQTAAEIRTLVNSASDSNVFTDADHSKLNAIESGATADQSQAEIVSLIASQTIAPNNINSTNVYATDKVGRDANDYITWSNNSHCNMFINGSNEFRFEADGDFHADGDVIAYSTTTASDENLKENIVTVTDAVAKVEALKGVTFKWKKNELVSAGVIAQDVEKVLPEVVKTVGDLDGKEYKAVNYGGLTSILIEAIKDLSARIKVLEAK